MRTEQLTAEGEEVRLRGHELAHCATAAPSPPSWSPRPTRRPAAIAPASVYLQPPVARGVITAIEKDRAEVNAAELLVRIVARLAGLAPELMARPALPDPPAPARPGH